MTGLTSEQARAALERVGQNSLPAKPQRALLARIFAQLKNALIYLLLAALAVDLAAWMLQGAVGVPLEALAILAIIFLNAGLGVLQEYRSEQALLELQRLGAPHAWVLRDQSFVRIAATQLVPADVVRLEAGDRVPADGIVEAPESLSVDESVLTGELLPVDKAQDEELLCGTLVTHGHCLMSVSRTGKYGNMGKLATSIGTIDTTKTPLEQRVAELGGRIARVVLVLYAGMALLGFAVQGWSHPLPILAPLRDVMGLVPRPTPYLGIVALALLTTLALGELILRVLRPKVAHSQIALAA